MTPDQIALQLYTVRTELARDVPATLRAVAAMGYHHVEIASPPPMPPAELRAELDRAGLDPLAAHVPLEKAINETDQVFDELESLRCPVLVIPWLSEPCRGGREAGRRIGNALGPVAAEADRRSIAFAYHNHDFEFSRQPDGTLWDGLLATAPRSLMLEMDVYWIALAGHDPVAFIGEHAGRVWAIHAKDVEASTRRPVMPGEGTLPWREILDAARSSGAKWYIAEQDDPASPLDAAARGYAALRSLARCPKASQATRDL
jgi:sugar phosphate isomerase/epimerase